MRRLTRAFVKNIFGADYNKTVRTLLIDLVIFWGLRTSGLRVEVAPFILYLTVAAFYGRSDVADIVFHRQ